jgi:uncharacterized membrane protein
MSVSGGQSNVGCTGYFSFNGFWRFLCGCLWLNPYLGALLTSERGRP